MSAELFVPNAIIVSKKTSTVQRLQNSRVPCFESGYWLSVGLEQAEFSLCGVQGNTDSEGSTECASNFYFNFVRNY